MLFSFPRDVINLVISFYLSYSICSPVIYLFTPYFLLGTTEKKEKKKKRGKKNSTVSAIPPPPPTSPPSAAVSLRSVKPSRPAPLPPKIATLDTTGSPMYLPGMTEPAPLPHRMSVSSMDGWGESISDRYIYMNRMCVYVCMCGLWVMGCVLCVYVCMYIHMYFKESNVYEKSIMALACTWL